MKDKYKKLYDCLLEAKEIQADIVGNHGLQMSKKEREEIVKVWNTLDNSMETVYSLWINKE